MRDDLAEELLGRIMDWDGSKLSEHGPILQALAKYKYDGYGSFRPGERFLESLARWLWQFDTIEERRVALEFVRNRLVFISDGELEHAISLVYRDIVRPLVRAQVAAVANVSIHHVRKLTGHAQFRRIQRQLLVMGLSDGARLDRLRRASPELSHEQFVLVTTPRDEVLNKMSGKLAAALGGDSAARFRHLLLVDDFAGSGFTMIRRAQEWAGKLIDVRDQLIGWQESGLVESPTGVTIVLYVASEAAECWIRKHLSEASLPWELHVVQVIPASACVGDGEMEKLCRKYYDPVMCDAHKGDAPLGYRDSRLPLVLAHNAPNNSICLLWADTSERADSNVSRHALFPRYERHSAERP